MPQAAAHTARYEQEALDLALPISPQINHSLRRQIIRCDLKPGDRISESEIARAFSVSRQPVREAFIKLAEQGLLTVLPQRGTTVTRIAYAAVLDARFMREAIESDIVAILVRRPTTQLVSTLRSEIAAQRAVDPDDAVGFSRLDERFHRTLATAAEKAGAWTLLEGLKAQMDRVRFLSLATFPIRRLIEQHQALVDRIEAADAQGADAAIRVHLREVLRDLPHIRDANPAFFDIPAGADPEPVLAPIRGGTTT
jgi:DNA-binding GntR family transcriptional regulator